MISLSYVVLVTPGLFLSALLDEPLRFSNEQAQLYYDQSYSAKRNLSVNVDFAFIESVPVIARVKSTPPESQVYASIAMHAFMRHAAEVAVAFARESSELRKTVNEYAKISQVDYDRAMRQYLDLAPVTPSSEEPERHTHPHDHTHTHGSDDSPWAGIKRLVPKIEELGRIAGYNNIQEEATPGIAVCLLLADTNRVSSFPNSISAFLQDRFISASFQDQVALSWEQVARALHRDTPLILHGPASTTFLIVGYLKTSDGKRVLFGFSPEEVERIIYLAGRLMTESKLDEFQKTNPLPDSLKQFQQIYYSDVLSSHKQIQHPGFVVLRYSDDLSFSFIAEPSIDATAIRKASKQVFDSVLEARKSGQDRDGFTGESQP